MLSGPALVSPYNLVLFAVGLKVGRPLTPLRFTGGIQAASTLESDDSFATGRRDRAGTKAEKELTKIFEGWLNSTTFVLRAAIFGDNTVSSSSVQSYSLRKEMKRYVHV